MKLQKLVIRIPFPFCFCIACMLLAMPAHAQTTSLSGIVTDAAGATAPGTSLILTGVSGAERATISNEAGFYRFVQLVPGKYTLRTELKGFKTIKQTLDLLVDTPMTFDIRLEVGSISETVRFTNLGHELEEAEQRCPDPFHPGFSN